MSSRIKKPKLNGLAGSWRVDKISRETLNIPNEILFGPANTWNNPKSIVQNYVKESDQPDFKDFYENSIRALNKLKDGPASEFASNCIDFLKTKDIKKELMNYFVIEERNSRKKNAQETMQQEVEITSMTVTTNEIINLAESSNSRKRKIIDEQFDTIDDINNLNDLYDSNHFTDDPFNFDEDLVRDKVTIIKNKKIYDFHIPNHNNVSPNKPSMQKEDYESLSSMFKEIFDIYTVDLHGEICKKIIMHNKTDLEEYCTYLFVRL